MRPGSGSGNARSPRTTRKAGLRAAGPIEAAGSATPLLCAFQHVKQVMEQRTLIGYGEALELLEPGAAAELQETGINLFDVGEGELNERIAQEYRRTTGAGKLPGVQKGASQDRPLSAKLTGAYYQGRCVGLPLNAGSACALFERRDFVCLWENHA